MSLRRLLTALSLALCCLVWGSAASYADDPTDPPTTAVTSPPVTTTVTAPPETTTVTEPPDSPSSPASESSSDSSAPPGSCSPGTPPPSGPECSSGPSSTDSPSEPPSSSATVALDGDQFAVLLSMLGTLVLVGLARLVMHVSGQRVARRH